MKIPSTILLIVTALISSNVWSQAQGAAEGIWRGKPFIMTTATNDLATYNNLPDQRSYELEGETLIFTAQDNSGNFALLQSTGASSTRLLENSTTVSSGGNFQNLAERIFQRQGTAPSDALVVQAEVGGVSGYYQRVGSNWEEVLKATDLMPGQTFGYDQLGEPHAGNGKVAYLGINNAEGYRGVYVRDLATNTVTTVADSSTALPGIGSFDLSSSQVGFDGESVAFWGIHQASVTITTSGIYFKSPSGALQSLAITGDTIPGTSIIINSFQSPPAVADGEVAFVAFDASFNRYLLHWDGSTVRLVVKNGDTLPGGGTITDIAFFPPVMSGDTIAFGAKLDGEEAVFEDTLGTLSLVLKKSTLPFYSSGSFLTSFTPVDIEGDTMAIEARQNSLARVFVNQGSPPKPFIPGGFSETIVVNAGDSVTLTPQVFGQAPLDYSWTISGEVVSTDESFTIPAFTAGDRPFVDIAVSNALGNDTKRYTIQIDGPPVIFFTPETAEGFEGVPLNVSVSAIGPYAMSYQWQKGTSDLAGQNTRTLTLTSPTSADAGTYRVIVTNEKGSTTSTDIQVNISPVPENPSFGGTQYVDLFTDPADEPASAPFDKRFAYTASGNLLYFTTTGATPGIIEIDQAGVTTVFKSLPDLATELGLSAILSIQDIHTSADGKIYFLANQQTPSFKQVVAVLDAGVATAIYSLGEDFPDLPGQAPSSLVFSGLGKGRPIIGLYNNSAAAYRYYRDNGSSLDFFFDGSSSLTDGSTSSASGAYFVSRASEPGFLVSEYPSSSSAILDRIWQIDYLTGAASILYEDPLDFDGTLVTIKTLNLLGSDSTSIYVLSVGGVVKFSDAEIVFLTAPGSTSHHFADGKLFGVSLFSIYRHEGDNTWIQVYDSEFHDGQQLQRLIASTRIFAAQGDRIAFSAPTLASGTVYITNRVGDGATIPPLRVEASYDPTTNTYSITVPDGLELWTSTTLLPESWSKLADSGNYSIVIDSSAAPKAFYRLQSPGGE